MSLTRHTEKNIQQDEELFRFTLSACKCGYSGNWREIKLVQIFTILREEWTHKFSIST